MDDYIAILNLASRYARALDTCDWDGLGACFTQDAILEFASYPPPLEGRPAIVKFMRVGRERFDVTQHVVGSPSAHISGDTATASFYVLAQHVAERDGTTRQCLVGVDYTDELSRTPAGWQLAHRRVRRLWSDGDATLLDRPPDGREI